MLRNFRLMKIILKQVIQHLMVMTHNLSLFLIDQEVKEIQKAKGGAEGDGEGGVENRGAEDGDTEKDVHKASAGNDEDGEDLQGGRGTEGKKKGTVAAGSKLKLTHNSSKPIRERVSSDHGDWQCLTCPRSILCVSTKPETLFMLDPDACGPNLTLGPTGPGHTHFFTVSNNVNKKWNAVRATNR